MEDTAFTSTLVDGAAVEDAAPASALVEASPTWVLVEGAAEEGAAPTSASVEEPADASHCGFQ